MQQFGTAIVAGLIALSFAGATIADSKKGMSEGEKSAGHAAMSGHDAAKGQHAMTGEITKLDKETGKLTLKTEAAELELHYPPDAVKDLNTGDTITAHLGFTTDATEKGSVSAFEEKKEPASNEAGQSDPQESSTE